MKLGGGNIGCVLHAPSGDSHIRRLNLSGNNIGDKGATLLAEMLKVRRACLLPCGDAHPKHSLKRLSDACAYSVASDHAKREEARPGHLKAPVYSACIHGKELGHACKRSVWCFVWLR